MERIYFDRKINSQKPSTIRNSDIQCPFCDYNNLTGIVEELDDLILVKNKFSTLENADMFVLIESRECNNDMHSYPLAKIESLLEYGIDKWKQLEASGKYKSVAFFKNKGALSSGTIKHPHMQLIGFRDQECMRKVGSEHISGHDVIIEGLMPFNLSDYPLISFLEINIEITEDLSKFAKTVSFLANYMEEIYWGDTASYNFFFYLVDGKRYLKIMPRYATSAITVGYDICQVYKPEQLVEYEQLIKKSYQNWDIQ